MCLHYSGRSTACTKTHAHTQSITSNIFPQKGTMIPNMTQSRYPLNSQVLAIFLPFATIPATPHYSLSSIHQVFSTVWYVILYFFKHSSTFPSPLCFHLVSQSYSQPNDVYATIPDPWPNFSDPTPVFFHPFTWFRLCWSSKDNVPG